VGFDYINTFLKLKAEVSGYPDWVRSPADEELYVETFWNNEGIGSPSNPTLQNGVWPISASTPCGGI